jgi:hypothetical protein
VGHTLAIRRLNIQGETPFVNSTRVVLPGSPRASIGAMSVVRLFARGWTDANVEVLGLVELPGRHALAG